MSRKAYYASIVFSTMLTLILIYMTLRKMPSLPFYTDLNAYIFASIFFREYPFLLLIVLHPILLFTILFIEDSKGLNYEAAQARYSWVFMTMLLLVFAFGFIFYGFDTNFAIDEFTIWEVSQFTFFNTVSPLIYLLLILAFSFIQSSFYIHLYFLVKKVTTTWWLKIPLIVSVWLALLWLIPHLINTSNPNLPDQMIFIVPNLDRPIWFGVCYFVMLKAVMLLIIKGDLVKSYIGKR